MVVCISGVVYFLFGCIVLRWLELFFFYYIFFSFFCCLSFIICNVYIKLQLVPHVCVNVAMVKLGVALCLILSFLLLYKFFYVVMYMNSVILYRVRHSFLVIVCFNLLAETLKPCSTGCLIFDLSFSNCCYVCFEFVFLRLKWSLCFV